MATDVQFARSKSRPASSVNFKKITRGEAELLDATDIDFLRYGETDAKCPRCGKGIVRVSKGNSYTIKCVDDSCISIDYRGV